MPPSKTHHSKLSNTFRFGLCALVGITAVGISVSYLGSRESVRYTKRGHFVEALSPHNENFRWYNEKKLLVGNVNIPYPEYHLADALDGKITKFDPSHYAKSDFYTPSQLDYSPNHQLLLTSKLYGRKPWIVTMKQDGTDIMSHGIKPGYQQVWFRDNVHWATLNRFGQEHYITVSSIDSPIPIQTIDLRSVAKTNVGKVIWQAKILCQDNEGKLLIYVETVSMRGASRRSQSIWQFDSLRGDTKGMELPIQFQDIAYRPNGELLASIEGIALSPDGKRLAWTTSRYLYPPHLPLFLLRLISRVRGVPKYVSELRVSNRDLSDMQIIGQEEINAKNNNFSGPDVLMWSPDGTKLAFRYIGTMWVIPINLVALSLTARRSPMVTYSLLPSYNKGYNSGQVNQDYRYLSKRVVL